ncbi:hypothetical protein Tco_0738119 [Tanacetum coccineum]
MLFFLIKNLCAPFGVPFDPKRYYKDGVCAIMLRRPRSIRHMALPPREQRRRFLRYEGLEYPDTDIVDFEGRLARIHRREVHRVPIFDFGGLSNLMAEGLSGRRLMEHHDKAGVSVFTSRDWRRMFDIRGPLLILEFFTTFSARQIPNKGDLRDYWMGISSAGDFLSTAPLYTLIRDPILRLCHRLIACSIAGRSQAPEKVTVTDLFYLRGMDVGSVNVPYLLARYLRLFAAGRKSGAHISGGQFVARLAEHFGLLTAEILGELTVITPELPVIDMAELVRLHICVELDDTWAWVAMGPERLEEDMHEICQGLTEQQEVIDAMAGDDESRYEQERRWNIYTNYDDAYEINHENNEKEELCEVHELPVCNIRRYMMIKYSFNNDEEYVAVKEDEYDDPTITREEACRAYQEIFRKMDEGWMDPMKEISTKLVECIFSRILLIMEYLVKDSKRCAFWNLNEDILKITILKTNTPYPLRKIRRIVPALAKDHKGMKLNTPYTEDVNTSY